MKIVLSLTILSLSCAMASIAADFDGDGVADEFAIIRDVAKEARAPGVQLVNPWQERSLSRQSGKELGLRIRLSRAPRTYLIHYRDFFTSPMWTEGQAHVKAITRKDSQYRAWKKQVPDLKADAIQLPTEAGIDILLYWNGKQWLLFQPAEDP